MSERKLSIPQQIEQRGHTSYTLNAAENMVTIEQIGLLPRMN